MTMLRQISALRVVVLACAFLTTAFTVRSVRADRAVMPATPLRAFPLHIGSWAGRPALQFDARVVRVLGADDYLSRVYANSAAPPVDLFIGYYGSQRSGAVIHSPLNCLPGAGWQPVSRRRLQLLVDDRARPGAPPRRVEVNEVLVQQGEEQRLALYWYHERGRVVASEYASRFFMVLDAVRSGRTDGALIRVMTPADSHADANEAARDRLGAFVREVFSTLDRYLPA